MAAHRSGSNVRRRIARHLAAVIAVVLALLLRVELERRSITLPVYVTFYPVVFLAAVLGDIWTGILATALSALLADYFLLPPVGQFAIHSTSDIVGLTIFCVSGVTVSVVAELVHRSRGKQEALRFKEAVRGERRKVEEAQYLPEAILAERLRFLGVLESLRTRNGSPVSSEANPIHQESGAAGRESRFPSLDQKKFRALLRRTVMVPFIAALILAGAALWAAYDLHTSMQWVDHTDQVMAQSRRLLRLTVDMETGERGYLLTGEEAFLKPYRDASTILDSEYQTLYSLVADNPQQQKRLEGLHESLHHWQGYAEQMIVLRRKGGDYANLKMNLAGKTEVDEIRNEIAGFQSVEELLLDQRNRTAHRDWRLVETICILLGLGIGSGLMIFTFRRMEIIAATFEESGRALAESERRWATTLTSIGDAVMATDNQGRVTFLNPAAAALTGWQSEEALGQPVQNVFQTINEQTRLPAEDIVSRVLTEGRVVELANHTALLRRDGREIPIADSAAPIQDSEGKISGVVLVFHDVTERRQAETVLRATLQRFYTILSNLSSGILLVTNEGRIEFVNQAFCDLFRLTETPADLIANFDSEKVIAKIDTAYENPEQATLRVREIVKQGQLVLSEELPIQNGCLFIRDFVPLTVDGKLYGRMWVHTDITEVKRKEEALRESRAKLEAALAAMADSVIITDAEGRFVEFNEAYAKFYRFKSKAECARSFTEFAGNFDVFLPSGEPLPREKWASQRALRGETAVGAEYTLLRKDTGESWIGSLSFSPIRDSDGTIIGSVVTSRDITEAKRAEEERQIAIDFLGMVNQSRGSRDLLERAAAFFQKRSGCEAVGIRMRDGDDYPYFEARGFSREFVRLETKLCVREASGGVKRDSAGKPVLECLCGNVIRGQVESSKPFYTTQGSFWTGSTGDLVASAKEGDLPLSARNRCSRAGYESVALLPIYVGEERFGLVQLNDRRKGRFSAQSILLWERLAGHLATAVSKFQAEEALRESEVKYRGLFEGIQEMVTLYEVERDDRGRVSGRRLIDANPAFLRTVGAASMDELRGKAFNEFFGATWEAEHRDAVQEAMDSGKTLTREVHSPENGRDYIATFVPLDANTYLGTARDITERKRAEEDSKNSFVTLSNFVPQMVWICMPDGLNTYFNQRWVDYTGLTLEESYGRGWNTPFHPDDKQPAWEAWNKAVETGGEYSIESRLRAADGSYRRFLIRGEPMRDASGCVLRWFGTCTDIEDMKQESEGRFRSVVESMSEGLMLFDPKGNAIYQNPASLRIHALEAKSGEPLEAELLKAAWKGWDEQGRPLSPDEWPMSRVFQEGRLENQVLHAQRIDTGHEFDASYNGCLLRNSSGNVTGGFITIHDITERKRSEEALRSSQKQLQAIIDGAPDTIVFLKDLDGRFITVNSRFEQMLGITRDEVRGKTDFDILTRERAETYREHDRQVLTTGKPIQMEEVALLADGIEHTFLASKFPLVDASGKPYAVCAISVDITERKRMEGALQESEKRYRNLFNSMNEGFCVIEVLFDADGKPEDYRFLEANAAFENQTGLHDAVGKRMRDLAPEHEEHWFEIYGRIALTGEAQHFMNEAKALNRVYDVHAYRVGEPEQRRVAIVFNDFSDYKRAQDALRASEAQFRNLANAIPQLCWMANADGGLFWYNERWYQYTGTTSEQMEGWGWQSVHDPDVLPQVMERWKLSIETGDLFDMVFPLRGADGAFRPFLTRVMPVKDLNGKVIRWFGTNTDISERLQAEDQLKKLNRTLNARSNSDQAILHATDEPAFLEEVCRIITTDCGHAMVWIGVAEDDDEKTVRPVAYSGFEEGYLETLRITWDESECGRGPTGTAIRTGQPSMCRNMLTDPAFAPWRVDAIKRGYASSLVIPLMDRDKAWGALTIYSREPDAFSEGEVELLKELAGDLEFGIQTLRLRAAHAKAEEVLRESEELLGLFAEHAPAALAMFDHEMRYLHASRRWRADYNLGDRDLSGVSHYDVFPEIPEQWKDAHRRGLAGEVLTGDDDRFERADGSAQWIRWEIRPWSHADGQVGGIVIFSEDTTRRKEAEAALLRNEKLALQREQLQALAKRLQQAREEERKMVARDLHDQIGQILTAIKMDMAWAVRHLPNTQKEVHDRLKGSIELVNDGVRSVRAICSGLRPGILDDLGLAAAIEWQAHEFASRTGIACKVSIPPAELHLDGDLSTAIFRIFQECLTNVARHAEAQSVSASLSTQDEDLLLVVRDAGKGFHESEAAASLGVLGMKERAKACGGDVQVSSSPGKGTTVTVRVPMRAPSDNREDHAHSDSR